MVLNNVCERFVRNDRIYLYLVTNQVFHDASNLIKAIFMAPVIFGVKTPFASYDNAVR